MDDVDQLVQAIAQYRGAPVKLMEVCGTHTHNIFHFGIPALFPPSITLISGPGCPVCVTPAGYIARACRFSLERDTTLCSFGDMLRVPGNGTSLLQAKASGGSVAMIYSPMDVIPMALAEPSRTFVVAAVGFETTLPIYALLVKHLREKKIENVRLFISVKSILPAIAWICRNEPDISGFIGPGHASAVIGSKAYEPLCADYGIPMAIAGFGYEQILAAVYDLIIQIGQKRHEVHNLYPGVVSGQGNTQALALIEKYFTRKSSVWRGLGSIPESGFSLRSDYEIYDAGPFDESADLSETQSGCLCGKIITGRASPADCPMFGNACTPASPIGPCMVSSEGTCGIWHSNRSAAHAV